MNRSKTAEERVDKDSSIPISGYSSEPISGYSSDTLRVPAASIDVAALAILGSSLPPLEPITEQREILRELGRRDTPHTFVMPIVVRQDRATLTMLGGPHVGASFALDDQETRFGRGSNATICLDEPSVSRNHARIVRDDAGRHLIEDLGSTNGTFVNARRIHRVALRSGDRVQLGRECLFRFAMVDEAEEAFQRRLYESSMRDTLTGIGNRRFLFERLSGEIVHARREGLDLAVVMFDVDHFKRINDAHGHLVGDQVLRGVALAAGTWLRAGDLFARYGGEEFAVVLRDVGRDEAVAMAERLRSVISELRVESDAGSISVTVSVGLSLLSESDSIDDGLELFARADARLYTAKVTGRDRVCAYD